jgi:hypothetical protein
MAAAQTLNRNIDRELAFTDETVIPGVKHIQFDASPGAWIFLGDDTDPANGRGTLRGAGKRMQRGGQKVQINHAVESSGTAKRMAGAFDTYNTNAHDFVRRSEANWKHYSDSRVLSLTDDLINQGPDALASIVTEETFNVMGSLIELAVTDVFAGSAATAMTGLDTLIGDTGTVQGLAAATYTQWASRGTDGRTVAAGSRNFASGSFAGQGLSDFRKAWDNSSEGMRTPNVILTTYDIHQFYEGSLVPQERYSAPAATGDAGFMNLMFRRAPVLPDPNATSGVAYFLNTNIVYTKCLEGAGFEFQPWDRANNQEVRASELVFKGQMCVEDRRLVNKLTTIVA